MKDFYEAHKPYILATIMLLFVCAFIFMVQFSARSSANYITDVSYSEFEKYVAKGSIASIRYQMGENDMYFRLKTEDTDAEEQMIYRTTYPDYEGFKKEMLDKGIAVQITQTSSDSSSWWLWVLILFIVIFLIMRNTTNTGKIMNMGNHLTNPFQDDGNKDIKTEESNVRFADIVGQDEILDDIKFITTLIKYPERGEKMGAKAPRGILLQGPPGTGKTLIAKAIAGEANVSFIYANASSFMEMYVGVGAKRVRQLFSEARKKSPCVVFIDEIDSIGGSRNAQGRNSEDDKTVNALLQEMDGFKSRDGIFVIAATNNADSLDKALVRAGRFDRQITVNPPRNWEVRRQLYKMYLQDAPLGDDVSLSAIAKETAGFTGADIAAACNEAKVIAIMRDQAYIDTSCLEEAIDKKIFKGNRAKDQHKREHDREIVAYHEAGHAVMTYLCGQPIARASIQSTISGVGGVVFQEEPDTSFQTEESLRQQIMICYAGRASEDIKFKNVTTGASNDITQATRIMSGYIEHYGFNPDFGMVDMSILQQNRVVDSHDITSRISSMSNDLYKECHDLLEKNYNKVENLAKALLEHESMSGEEIMKIIGD
ncbi:cell division protease FtsH [Lachnospiraceae bacterium]|nr:cell division protease FtsH [Lachnospiraceae bacterium]